MSQYTEDTANDLADKALAEAEAVGDGKIVDQIGELLGASSQSLQEAYLTAVRVRRAEKRAREMLADSAMKRGAIPAAKVEKPAQAAPSPQPDTVPEPPKTPETPPKAEEAKPKRKGW